MIWSLVRVLIFVGLVAGLAFGAALLLETGGAVQMAVAGWEFTLGPLQVVLIVVVIVILIWLVMRLVGLIVALLRFLNGDETALSRHFGRNRERKGYQALADAMVALAAGEPRTALTRAQRANRYLHQPELTDLIVAQAAEMAGDGSRATDAYKRLLQDDRTRFIAIRGLLKQKISEGDQETALALAQKAYALKPRHPETQDLLLQLQADQADWKGARATLEAKLKSGALPRDVYRRRDAVLALQEARGVMDEAATVDQREAAIEANRKSPDLIPAAAMAARGLIARGDAKGATRVLKKAWEAQPHPDLAAAFAEIAPDETATARIARFRQLVRLKPDHEESRLLMAELHIAADDFPEARRDLGDIPTTHPTRRSLAIMAAIERGEGADEAVVRGWLSRALTAPRGPQWCCDKCQTVHSDWAPVCANCHGFDTLSWREPVETTGPSPTGTELLPLFARSAPPPPDPEPEPQPPEALVPDADVTEEPPQRAFVRPD